MTGRFQSSESGALLHERMPTDAPGPWRRSQVTFHVTRTAANQALATRYVLPSIAKRLRVPGEATL